MTIEITAVDKDGETIEWATEPTWVSLTPWYSTLKYVQHELDGADYDVYYVTGKNSATCTLTGIYRRSEDNDACMARLVGATLSISHPVGGDSAGLCIACSPALSSGGLWVTVSMTLVSADDGEESE